jgi:vacuolar protein-sorting-associated protein 4
VIVRDALMQPVRKVLSATHFKQVCVARSLPTFAVPLSSQVSPERPLIPQVEVDTPEGKVTKLTPCSPGAPDAIERTWTDVQSDELLEPLLSVKDFQKAIQVNRPTVSQADIAKHIAFTNESGECADAMTRQRGCVNS